MRTTRTKCVYNIMRKKEEQIQIEGFNLLLEAMKEQNKGSVVLSQETGVSILTIYKIVRGGNFLADTMNKLCKELGLKLVIKKDENANPTVHKRVRNVNGNKIVPKKRKIKVPIKEQK